MANKFWMMGAINKLYWLSPRLSRGPVGSGTALPAVFRNAPFAVARRISPIRLAEVGALEALYAPGPEHAWVTSKIHFIPPCNACRALLPHGLGAGSFGTFAPSSLDEGS